MSADPRTEPVLNAVFFVHSALGPGLLEAVYEALRDSITRRALDHR